MESQGSQIKLGNVAHTLHADVRPVHAKQQMIPRVHSSSFSSKTMKVTAFKISSFVSFAAE